MKHAKPETPLERADRLIWELKGAPRVIDMAYQIIEDHVPCDECQEKIIARNLKEFRWHIENPIQRKVSK